MNIEFEESGVILTVEPLNRGDGLQIDDIDISETLQKIRPDELANATKSIAAVGAELFREDPANDWMAPKEAEVEFGVAIGVGGRLLVAKGDVKAHLKIKLKW